MFITSEWTLLEVYESTVACLKEKGLQVKVYMVNKYHQVKAYVADKCEKVVTRIKEGYEKVRNFFVNKATGEFVFAEEATETVRESESAGVLLLPHFSVEGQEDVGELPSEEKINLTINDFAAVVGEFKLTPSMLKTALDSEKCTLHGKELSRYQKIARSRQYQSFLLTRAKERGFVLSKSELQELINRIVVNGRYTPEFMAMVNTYKTKGE
ncbi:hypothetical protein [Thiothrix nivea]|uniref:Uncharacterized protein n=1 Tax=Thiothrix nivea (strain ATCC 35100 / DSM 5205 / JP2) TaxID=870187 RepID=A0A656HEF4_THINJ|nr:hypothetical protein [Thiothrix nivea]EIJ35298.1 hypothetical protein Thini_2761 [Thiothrix nivea DSM 5205]